MTSVNSNDRLPPLPPFDAMPRIGLVIPCFNEASRLDLIRFQSFLAEEPSVDLCFVNDGSTDPTLSVLQRFREKNPSRVEVVDLSMNRGKAEAVRQGIHRCLSAKPGLEFIGYWDADLAVPLEELRYFFWLSQSTGSRPGFLLGSRNLRLGARIRRLWWRHYLGRVFASGASFVVRSPVYDTQCGAKVIQAELCEPLFREPFESRWIFDVELLARYLTLPGSKPALEVPLRAWEDKAGSKLNGPGFLRAGFELIRLWVKLRRPA